MIVFEELFLNVMEKLTDIEIDLDTMKREYDVLVDENNKLTNIKEGLENEVGELRGKIQELKEENK